MLRVKDIPVLYLPWFLFPANNDRQSGLLVPRLGYSNSRGFQYEQPFYWAINKSMDATLGVDYESAARIGALGEFRYRLSRQTRGTFDFAYYNQSIGGITNAGTINGTPATAPDNRYVIAADHRQPLARGGTFYVDGLGVSDQTILRDIDNYSYLTRGRFAYLRHTRSQVGVFQPWRDGFLQFDNVYDQDLYGPQEFVPERLPRIRAGQQMALADDRLVARVAAEGTEFWRETGFDGVRGVVAPELFVPFNAGNVVHGSISGQVRQNGYLLSNGEQLPFVVPDATTATGQFVPAPQLGYIKDNGRIPTLDRAKGFTYGVVSTRVATEVARVYDFPHLGWGKLRHSIEPEVQYLYVPQTSRPTFLANNLPAVYWCGG